MQQQTDTIRNIYSIFGNTRTWYFILYTKKVKDCAVVNLLEIARNLFAQMTQQREKSSFDEVVRAN